MLVRENAGTIQVYAAATVVIFTSNLLPTDEWAHFALVYDISTNELTCYINNSSQTLTMPAGWAISGTLFYIGKRQNNINFWTGKMDQVSVFDYALPATGTNSVATLYGGGTAVTNPMSLSPAAVTYYQLGDQSVSTGPTSDYLVPNNSLQDYVFASGGSLSGSIDLANPVPLGTNKTVSFWFKLSSSATFSFSPFTSIVNSGNCYYPYFISSSSTYNWYVSDTACGGSSFSNLGSGGVVEPNKWVHAAVVGDGSNVKCYINGLLVNDDNNADRNPTIQRLFTGMTQLIEFSNFSIFNTNLSATGTESIASLYNNGTPPDLTNYSNISHWWKLNAQDTFDGTNWTIKDYAGSNDGTSNGMTSANLVQSNLQHTSGYSPYALSFDGIDQFLEVPFSSDLRLTNIDFTISFWTNPSVTGRYIMLENYNPTVGWGVFNDNGTIEFYNSSGWLVTGTTVPNNVWTNIVLVGDIAATNLKVYKNGVQDSSNTSSLVTGNATGPLTIGAQRNGASGFDYNGNLSNVAIWSGVALTSSEITEIYNQGVPSNLNTFSGTAPVSWWQIGSNSSFNATTSQWTCLDEVGTNNAISSTNMANDDITNGVGYSANGLGTSSIDIKGDAPYSSANGLSKNMDVLDRATDVPS
jgi:hypothetical protein